jgi:hypothetical protein
MQKGGKLVKLLCRPSQENPQMHPILENSTACTMSMPRTSWLAGLPADEENYLD